MIRCLKIDQLEGLREILSAFAFCEWKSYRFFNRRVQEEYLLRSLRKMLEHPLSRVMVLERKGKVSGLLAFEYSEWDSMHFGVKTGRIKYLTAFGHGEEGVRVRSRLINFLLNVCKEERFGFLTAKTDPADISSAHALGMNKFRLMNTLLVFSVRNDKVNSSIKALYKVRDFRSDDAKELCHLAQNGFWKSHFHRDTLIPAGKADSLYASWVKDYIRNAVDSKILVAEKNGAIAGFIAVGLYNKELEDLTGFKILGQGELMAVAPSAKGASLSLIKATLRHKNYYDYAESHTSITNHEVIRISLKFNFSFSRASHIFHYHLK